MMSARQAERCAAIAWDSFKRLTASEAAAQAAIAGTAVDFEIFALEYLTEAFLIGKPPQLAKRIDAERYSAVDGESGDYYFDFDKISNLEQITYVQGLIALREKVPSELRLKYKQLHARGATPWEAYSSVMREWEVGRMAMAETPAVADDAPTALTDEIAMQMLGATSPPAIAHYKSCRKSGKAPADAFELAIRKWRGAA